VKEDRKACASSVASSRHAAEGLAAAGEIVTRSTHWSGLTSFESEASVSSM